MSLLRFIAVCAILFVTWTIHHARKYFADLRADLAYEYRCWRGRDA